jgi:sarcosine oxidase/L-pipecolate oxidase
LVLVADKGQQGEYYVRESYSNVLSLCSNDPGIIAELSSKEAIEKEVGTGGGSGDWGYVNNGSGWADAEGAMCWLRNEVESTGRVTFVHGQAVSLLRSPSTPDTITGALLKDGQKLSADLTILATGAWSGSLIDLCGRATATGQCLAYLEISDEEQARLGKTPVLLNMSTGMFIIPPKDNIFKIARHGYGYCNPVSISNPDSPITTEKITVSSPRTCVDDPAQQIPQEGMDACRAALKEMVPWLADRPFSNTRLCWYTDTPNGDFLITHHPDVMGVFLATGGSGHGFKFLPVIGDAIVDVLEGNDVQGEGEELQELKRKWAWPKDKAEVVVTEDGSRGGRPGMILDEEIAKS